MKRFAILGSMCIFSCCLHAQVVDTTVCDILKDPASFNGKMVRIKGTASSGFDQFVVKGPGCGMRVSDIWLSYPEGTKGKAGPAAMIEMQPAQNYAGTVAAVQRTPVVLDKSKDFKQFDSLLAAPAKSSVMCLGCQRYEVSATMVGRLDGVEKAGFVRDKAGKITSWTGFGNLNAYSARLVLQSVSDVTSKEVDYSKNAALKDDNTITAGNTDPAVANRNAGKAFGAGSAGFDQITHTSDAFLKEGEKSGANGVFIVNGNLNEATAKAEAKGAKDSPDGILFNCGFNTSRLPGDALVRAYAHMGQHLVDLRTPEKGFEEAGYYEMEFRGWSTTILSIMAYGQKVMLLPGDTLLWSSSWTGTDKNGNATSAINGFLANEELLSR